MVIMKGALTILIADGSQIFRAGMIAALKQLTSVEKILEASTLEEAKKLVNQEEIDIAMMDVGILLDQNNNLNLDLQSFKYVPRVIAIGMSYDEAKFNNLVKAGFSGFILKSIQHEELCAALEIVNKGMTYFSHEIMDEIVRKNFMERPDRRRRGDMFTLTKREMEVLKLICEDMSNDEIARILYISPRTVDGHRANIINKLGVKSKVGLVKYALKNNLITN